MTLKVCAETIRIYDADCDDTLLATIETTDGCFATVSIRGPVSATDWRELSTAILGALMTMDLDGDKPTA